MPTRKRKPTVVPRKPIRVIEEQLVNPPRYLIYISTDGYDKYYPITRGKRQTRFILDACLFKRERAIEIMKEFKERHVPVKACSEFGSVFVDLC